MPVTTTNITLTKDWANVASNSEKFLLTALNHPTRTAVIEVCMTASATPPASTVSGVPIPPDYQGATRAAMDGIAGHVHARISPSAPDTSLTAVLIKE